MSLVPALAEQHAAHKARQLRMAGIIAAPPKPLPFAEPPRAPVVVPEPFDLSGPLKHQIVVLSHAGYSNGRIARRLKITKGVVSGVLHRARAKEHKMLMGEVIAIMFGLGFDTYDIAGHVGEPEYVVAKELARVRDRGRA